MWFKMAEQSKEKQANEQAKAQNLLLAGEKKKHFIVKMKRKISLQRRKIKNNLPK